MKTETSDVVREIVSSGKLKADKRIFDEIKHFVRLEKKAYEKE